jgi:lipopolysaccharide/colanic/teichoic acid biosynthesis glycosyltransferase
MSTRQVSASPAGATRPRIWGRLRFQLGGSLLFAILVPFGIWLEFVDAAELNAQAVQTLAGATLALMLGCWQFRTISQFPGVIGSYNIVSSFSLSFGLTVAIFFMLRLEYVRSIFGWSYLLSILWFYMSYWLSQRQRLIRIGFVPGSYAQRLQDVEGISWTPLDMRQFQVGRLEAIVADFSAEMPPEWERLIAEWSIGGVTVYSKKHLLESLTGQVEIEHLSENQFGSLIPASSYLKLKAFLDWCAAVLVLPLLAPLLGGLALLVRLDSPGPAIFAQRRMGFRGRPFTVYKFRTMTFAADKADDALDFAITVENDHRITRLGRILRKSRMDELPQIFNILRGEMSWIGPRPEAVALSQWYEAELPFYRYRHIVRPGVTGWAQVNQGHVADVESVQKKLNFDFYYIKYFSPWLDMLIIARTVKTMLTGFGSR